MCISERSARCTRLHIRSGSSEGGCSTRAGDLIAWRSAGLNTTPRRKLPEWYRPQAVSCVMGLRSTSLLRSLLPLIPFHRQHLLSLPFLLCDASLLLKSDGTLWCTHRLLYRQRWMICLLRPLNQPPLTEPTSAVDDCLSPILWAAQSSAKMKRLRQKVGSLMVANSSMVSINDVS